MQKELRYTAQVCRVRPYYSMSHPMFADFWRRASRLPEAADAAIADNCRFDERTNAQRWQALAQYLPPALPLDALTMGDWAEAECIHRENRITVPSLSIPDTFLDINRPAWLTELAEEQILVRLESLDWLLKDIWHTDLPALTKLCQHAVGDSLHTLQNYLDDWNALRDNRPSFAAFFNEVREQAEHADWPHQLRDRLGLGHYSPDAGDTIPVALMRYSLQDVLNAQEQQKWPAACALPGALDNCMHEYYFPAPAGHAYGATLHLAPEQADCLSAEILHCRIHYQVKHLWKLGHISRPHALSGHGDPRDQRLRAARDLHLLQLRIDCERDDFGEDMAGRT